MKKYKKLMDELELLHRPTEGDRHAVEQFMLWLHYGLGRTICNLAMTEVDSRSPAGLVDDWLNHQKALIKEKEAELMVELLRECRWLIDRLPVLPDGGELKEALASLLGWYEVEKDHD